MHKERCRMRLSLLLSFTHIHRPRDPVCLNDVTKLDTVCQLHFVAASNLHFLRRVSVAIDDGTRGFAGLLVEHEFHAFDKLEAGNRARLVEEIFLPHLDESEVIPPGSLCLSAITVE